MVPIFLGTGRPQFAGFTAVVFCFVVVLMCLRSTVLVL